MAGPKTSVQKARDEANLAAADNMFGSAFDGVEDITAPPTPSITSEPEEEKILEEVEVIEDESSEEEVAEEEALEPETPSGPPTPPSNPPSAGPPSGPPAPPSDPPSGPPTPPSGPPSPPSGPPSKPPSGPPSGPPSPPSGPPSKSPGGPLSGPPSPPSAPPSGPPAAPETVDELTENLPEQQVESVEEQIEEEEIEEEEIEEEVIIKQVKTISSPPDVANRAQAAQKEIIELATEVNSLRTSLSGAAEVIEELENPPMPPAVFLDIVVPDHLVADLARLARQLSRDKLVSANMGIISMLHPGMPGVMISTKKNTLLPRLNERGITGARLGQGAPEEGPDEWRLLEVLLASTSLETGGPAACIQMHGPYTTAASCEKDLILCSPIDEIGKKMLGKIIIVDPDDENPDDFLRQTAEALKQGGGRCVVIRGHGAFVVGKDLDDAWANAAMLEHSMQIVLLARQANLKV
ncbi:MAG TPA: hypothetical protein EYQ73_02930 [Candidatus Poseidoniales archaeon]|nr:MAG: hypothetical protein CXT71_04205 [Euryarchaeota archaeon]HIF45735.1 hypothetical protein [Candidatus Poseidoniales archaeon]